MTDSQLSLPLSSPPLFCTVMLFPVIANFLFFIQPPAAFGNLLGEQGLKTKDPSAAPSCDASRDFIRDVANGRTSVDLRLGILHQNQPKNLASSAGHTANNPLLLPKTAHAYILFVCSAKTSKNYSDGPKETTNSLSLTVKHANGSHLRTQKHASSCYQSTLNRGDLYSVVKNVDIGRITDNRVLECTLEFNKAEVATKNFFFEVIDRFAYFLVPSNERFILNPYYHFGVRNGTLFPQGVSFEKGNYIFNLNKNATGKHTYALLSKPLDYFGSSLFHIYITYFDPIAVKLVSSEWTAATFRVSGNDSLKSLSVSCPRKEWSFKEISYGDRSTIWVHVSGGVCSRICHRNASYECAVTPYGERSQGQSLRFFLCNCSRFVIEEERNDKQPWSLIVATVVPLAVIVMTILAVVCVCYHKRQRQREDGPREDEPRHREFQLLLSIWNIVTSSRRENSQQHVAVCDRHDENY